MVQTGTSLWPDEIRAVVKSPLSILLEQADALTSQTGGVLVGKLSKSVTDDKTVLNFDVIVPELDGYRLRIMVVTHKKDMNYPAMVDAEVFRPRGLGLGALNFTTANAIQAMQAMMEEPKKPANRADSDKELTELVRQVLRSGYVVSVAQSLISRVADANAEMEVAVELVPPTADVHPADITETPTDDVPDKPEK
jgi:hypothetical protein